MVTILATLCPCTDVISPQFQFYVSGNRDVQPQFLSCCALVLNVKTFRRYLTLGYENVRLDYQPLFGKMSPHSSPERAAGSVRFLLLV